MLLSTLVGEYSIAHDVSSGYVGCMYATVSAFRKYLERLPDTGDLNARSVNLFTRHLATIGRKPETIRGRRANLVVLWRFARKLNLVAKGPKGVKTIKIPETIPVAFLKEEIALLVTEADKLKGYFPGTKILRRPWWLSFLHAKFDTGLRLGDLLSLERQWIQGGAVTIVQSKTGECHTAPLSGITIELIDVHIQGRATGPIWTLWGRREVIYRAFKKLRESAGLKAGTSRWLRRSSFSYVEAENPGMGERHLGHKTPGLGRKRYGDRRIVKPRLCLPSPIFPSPPTRSHSTDRAAAEH